MFFKIGVLKNFKIFTGKHLFCSLSLKLQAWRPAKRLHPKWFHDFLKYLQGTFFTEQPLTTSAVLRNP